MCVCVCVCVCVWWILVLNTWTLFYFCSRRIQHLLLLAPGCDKPLNFINQFTMCGSNISSTESNVNIRIKKAVNVIDKLPVIWKSDPHWWNKTGFLPTCVCDGTTVWIYLQNPDSKHMEKKLDENNTRMLWVILNKFWKQRPTKQHLYGHFLAILQTILQDEQDAKK